MKINVACVKVLNQLRDAVNQMTEEEFVKSVIALNQSTIGQHVRHTLEFLTCLKDGYKSGLVNYDNRSHDKTIENNKLTAISVLHSLTGWLEDSPDDKKLKLVVSYDEQSDTSAEINTTFTRELIYNIEHAIHHMALIKVGVKEVCPHIKIDNSFGVAVSTLKYKRKLEETQLG